MSVLVLGSTRDDLGELEGTWWNGDKRAYCDKLFESQKFYDSALTQNLEKASEHMGIVA